MQLSRPGRIAGAVSAAALSLTLLTVPSDAVPAAAAPANQGATDTSAAQARAVAHPTAGAAGAGDRYFPLYGNGGYDVRHYALQVRYDPATDVLRGKAQLSVRATKNLRRFNLDLVGLTVRSVRVDGRKATWVRRADHELVITPARAIRKHRNFKVEVRYDGKPRTFSDPLLGTYGFLTTPDGAIAVGEPEVAAYWYPVNDHPEDKATYRITLTVPRGVEAISNGLPKPTVTRKGWSTTTWRVQHPMASYLAFLAIGQFDVHRWRGPNRLPIIDAVDSRIRGKLRKNIEASLARQGEIVAAESKWFGRYPFEAAGAVVDTVNVGFALENQTRPFYTSGFWGDNKESFQNDGVVVHELAHQWYGDSVALKRWRDIWLNEGFASYAEWLWADHEGQATPAAIFSSIYQEIPANDKFWAIRPGDPGSDNLFSPPVYIRGAMTLQALRAAVGDDDFFHILRSWARSRRDGNGTTKQFIALAERISGQQLDRLFNDWLYKAGKPAGYGPSTTSKSSQQRVAADRQQRVEDFVTSWRQDLARRSPHR